MRRSKLRGVLNGMVWDTEPTGPPAATESLPIDQDDWSCSHWMIYKDRLINIEGIENAKVTLLNDMEKSSMWSSVNNSCRFDCNFINAFEALGPEFNFSIISDIFCAGHSATTSAADAVADVGEGIGNVANLTKYVAPLAVVAAAAYVIGNPNKLKKLFK